MSVVTYNNITLPYSYTTSFEQTALRDKSDTDYYATKFEIEIQTILNSAFIESFLKNSTDYPSSSYKEGDIQLFKIVNNPAAIMRYLRTRLLQPRKKLSFKFNNVELIPQLPDQFLGTVDSQNGPKPQYCRIVQMSDDTFLLQYKIIAIYWEGKVFPIVDGGELKFQNQTNNPSVALYNRWTESVDINECQFSTRTRTGEYAIRSDNYEAKQADDIRQDLAVMGLQPGFIRKSSHYSVSEDGLTLKYRLVDEEQYKPPPHPALKASGKYIETTTKLQAIRMGEVSVRLEGGKGIDQAELIKVALVTAITKLRIAGRANVEIIQAGDPNPPPPIGGFIGAKFFSFLEYGSMAVDLYNNIVEVNLRVRLAPMKARIFGLAGMNDYREQPKPNEIPFDHHAEERRNMTFTYGTSEAKQMASSLYSSRGTANILLEAAKYYDPSLRYDLNIIRSDGQEPESNDPFPPAGITQMQYGNLVGQSAVIPEE